VALTPVLSAMTLIVSLEPKVWFYSAVEKQNIHTMVALMQQRAPQSGSRMPILDIPPKVLLAREWKALSYQAATQVLQTLRGVCITFLSLTAAPNLWW
jgi:hypothetical protein